MGKCIFGIMGWGGEGGGVGKFLGYVWEGTIY